MTGEKAAELLVKMHEALELNGNYPESLDVIEANVVFHGESEGFITDSPLSIARQLHDTDGAFPMHPLVAQYCLETYFDAYSEGDADAACDIGSLYYTGRAGEQSYEKAVEYYTFAAEHGCRTAQENLGYCYYYGRSVKKDYEKAYHYFVKGALDGHLISLYKIGDMYKNGYYVDKDEKEAFQIYSHCMDNLTDDSVRRCGADIYMRVAECLYKGIGTDKNLELALRFYQMAESYFYERLKRGDYMIKGNYERTIKEEQEVRDILMKKLIIIE